MNAKNAATYLTTLIRRTTPLLAVLGVTLAYPPQASQAQTYPVIGNVALQQANLTITPLADGNNLWDTHLVFTNLNAFTVNQAFFVPTHLDMNSQAAQWDNAHQEWERNGDIAAAANGALSLPLTASSTNLPLTPGYGVTPADSLSAFALGTFAPGQSHTVDFNYAVSPGVSVLRFNGGIISSPVPEPSSLALLLSLTMTGAGFLARRKKVRQAA